MINYLDKHVFLVGFNIHLVLIHAYTYTDDVREKFFKAFYSEKCPLQWIFYNILWGKKYGQIVRFLQCVNIRQNIDTFCSSEIYTQNTKNTSARFAPGGRFKDMHVSWLTKQSWSLKIWTPVVGKENCVMPYYWFWVVLLTVKANCLKH